MSNQTEDGLKRIKEAAMRGNETRRRILQEKYYSNPKRCLLCNEIIPQEAGFGPECIKKI